MVEYGVIPLPASTQWDIVAAKAKLLAPAHQELIRQAAQGDVLYNDDTSISRNMPAELQTIVANWLAHGRRQFVDVAGLFPEECRYVLEALKVVYKSDAEARQQKLSPEARLHFHQTHSRSVMEELQTWLNRQIDDRLARYRQLYPTLRGISV